MKRISSLFIFCLITIFIKAHISSDLQLTPQQIESIFLENNLELIAERMNVDIADAMVSQAKLWENPTLTISEVNLWSSRSQREGEDVVIPPIAGSFGKNTEFSVELSQLIQTANKRRKSVNVEKVNKEIAIQEFEEVLRGLKIELRQLINEALYLQSYQQVLEVERRSLADVTEVYQRQVEEGNLAKSELLRLQAALFEIENELLEAQTDWNRLQKEVKILLNLPPDLSITILSEERNILSPDSLLLDNLMELASLYRPDVKIASLQMELADKTFKLEKAQRAPDVTISAVYDRYGGVWRDFIGFGVGIDIPLLNRNQGNIKAARLGREQSRYLAMQQQSVVHNEIAENLGNYTLTYNFYNRMHQNPILAELDAMLDSYTRNLMERNISMLEYIDLLEAYKNNKLGMLNAEKNLFDQLEELQYSIGIDLNENIK